MTQKDLILSIDNGTQSVRALVIDLEGRLIAKSRIPIEPYFSTAPGLAEQDPALFWQAVCQACQSVLLNQKRIIDRIAGVALTTQRSTVINLDKNGKPLRPAIVWLDKRSTRGLNPIGGLWGILFTLSGMRPTVAYLQSEAEANWIYTHQPDIWAETYKYVFLSGYLTHQLTGRLVDSTGCQVGYMPFDYKNLHWSKKHDWKWQALPVQKEMLIELVHPTQILGEISSQASIETGIPAGTPLIAAAADKACEVLGAGCISPSIGCVSYGTTATINTIHKKYIEIIPLIPPYPAAIPGAYSVEYQIYRGYWMVNWFKQEFGLREQQISKELGIETEEIFDELANSVPPGSDGLTLLPFWSPGLKIPGPEARGAIIGFSDVHTRSHVYRAILEGIAYALREGAERTTKRSGVPIKELRIVGGGSQSNAAIQLTANIFGIPASQPELYEASGLGAAIDAVVGLGIYPDFETAINRMTRIRTTVEPDQSIHNLYNDYFYNVYKPLYRKLKPLFMNISSFSNK